MENSSQKPTEPPLDEWIEEKRTIPSLAPVFDKKGKLVGMEKSVRTVAERTRYTRISEPRKIDCGKGNHTYFIPDKHEHTAHCNKCTKRRFIRAVFEKVKDGHVLNRDTGSLIE